MSGANNQGEFSRQRALEKQRKEMLVRRRSVQAAGGSGAWLTGQTAGGIREAEAGSHQCRLLHNSLILAFG